MDTTCQALASALRGTRATQFWERAAEGGWQLPLWLADDAMVVIGYDQWHPVTMMLTVLLVLPQNHDVAPSIIAFAKRPLAKAASAAAVSLHGRMRQHPLLLVNGEGRCTADRIVTTKRLPEAIRSPLAKAIGADLDRVWTATSNCISESTTALLCAFVHDEMMRADGAALDSSIETINDVDKLMSMVNVMHATNAHRFARLLHLLGAMARQILSTLVTAASTRPSTVTTGDARRKVVTSGMTVLFNFAVLVGKRPETRQNGMVLFDLFSSILELAAGFTAHRLLSRTFLACNELLKMIRFVFVRASAGIRLPSNVPNSAYNLDDIPVDAVIDLPLRIELISRAASTQSAAVLSLVLDFIDTLPLALHFSTTLRTEVQQPISKALLAVTSLERRSELIRVLSMRVRVAPDSTTFAVSRLLRIVDAL